MRRVCVLGPVGLAAIAAALAACDSDASSSAGGKYNPDGGSFESGAGDSGRPRYTVDCSHPGAGAKLPDGTCECEQSLTVLTGAWSGLYTCRQNEAGGGDAGAGTCFERDLPESFVFAQTGNEIAAYEGQASAPTFVFEGVVCRDYFTWAGGPTDGKYTECGTLHFTDANHYVKDSCYLNAGADAGVCRPSFGASCPDQSGQCTNTGARSPATADAITKGICP